VSGKRVPAADGVHGEIDALFADAGRGQGEGVEQVAQLRVRLVFPGRWRPKLMRAWTVSATLARSDR
jgi:hypothetical protein